MLTKLFKNRYFTAIAFAMIGLVISLIFGLVLALMEQDTSLSNILSASKLFYVWFGAPTCVLAVLHLMMPERNDLYGLACGVYYGGAAAAFIIDYFRITEYVGFICSILAVWIYILKNP